MRYTLKVDYRTGDSFGSDLVEGEEVLAGLTYEEARENIKRIKEGTKWINNKESFSPRDLGPEPDYLVRGKEKWSGTSFSLLCEGSSVLISPFWIGYFETLETIYAEAEGLREEV